MLRGGTARRLEDRLDDEQEGERADRGPERVHEPEGGGDEQRGRAPLVRHREHRIVVHSGEVFEREHYTRVRRALRRQRQLSRPAHTNTHTYRSHTYEYIRLRANLRVRLNRSQIYNILTQKSKFKFDHLSSKKF